MTLRIVLIVIPYLGVLWMWPSFLLVLMCGMNRIKLYPRSLIRVLVEVGPFVPIAPIIENMTTDGVPHVMRWYDVVGLAVSLFTWYLLHLHNTVHDNDDEGRWKRRRRKFRRWLTTPRRVVPGIPV